ncbi:hypothetical protein EON64_12300 [archaeon]|nr:MAG: hypothetical protein EON64_12300 [archaeon]
MELARQEHELRKGIDWGERFYWSMKSRENEAKELNSLGLPPLPINSIVRDALEAYATTVGPLDASNVLNDLSDDELCVFFSQYPHIETLILTRWLKLSANVLRCISITSGASLQELDFSNSKVQHQHLQVILVRTFNLRVLRLTGSDTVDTQCARIIVQLSSENLRELYLNKCEKVGNDALAWLGGGAGVLVQSLARLTCLDLGDCNISDAGLLAVARGCKRLRFLNLENCTLLTDKSLVELAKNCVCMQLANLTNCSQLTNKAAVAMGRSWKDLRSINLSRCPLITDKGVKALAWGCKGLQAVNLAGLKKISEESMCMLADQCSGLLTLNLTGCERITMNGLEHLVRGLGGYVEAATTFLGFKPVDQHVEKKLADALKVINTRDYIVEEKRKVEQYRREEEERLQYERRLNAAALLVQQYIFRYTRRMHFFHLWRDRVKRCSVLLVQRVYRGFKGRCRGHARHLEVLDFLNKSPYALKIQKTVRAFLCRKKHAFVSQKVRELYVMRRREVEAAIIVRLQSQGRRYISRRRVVAWRELRVRNRINVTDAITTLQQLVRRFLARMKVQKVKSRQRVLKTKITMASEYYAAREIQRIFRGAMVLHWKDMRLNVIAAFVLDRHYVERRDSLAAARKRFLQFKQDNMQDSASEPDDEDWNELTDFQAWVKEFDPKKRRPYWQNHITNEITFDEPSKPLAHELGMLSKRVRVFWVVQNAWYEGTVTRYHKRKNRHRVEYDDGDHEWMNLDNEAERIQVQADDGNWVMYLMYQSEEKINELRKLEERAQNEAYKEQAFQDAMQWRSFTDDATKEVMFLSQITGELRTGAPFSLDWQVQDDGYGFPCFCNIISGAIVYEDPRFTYEVDDDLQQQRKFVMMELRYAMYVCKALWEEHQDALALGDPHQLNRVLLKIRNSPKCVHMNAFLLRAKALYKPTSIVDKPMEPQVLEELEYASWLSIRLGEVQDQAENMLRKRRDHKLQIVDKLSAATGQPVYCRHCGRETKKHLDFCATCGKPQIVFNSKPLDRQTRQSMLIQNRGSVSGQAIASLHTEDM